MRSLALLPLLALAACRADEPAPELGTTEATTEQPTDRTTAVGAAEDPAGSAYAVFAGGCFWCVEADFDKVPGVLSTTSGYAGGSEANPTYEDVGGGRTGHTEAVRVVYDSAKVTYRTLLDHFWRHHDPLTADRQFCDAGSQYRAAVFYRTAGQQALADSMRRAFAPRFPTPIVTEIVPATTFYRAEAYHQDFYRTTPGRYNSYRAGCRRDERVRELWGAG